MWYNGGETDMKPSDFLDMDDVKEAEEDFGKMNAIIRVKVPDYQIGEEVSIYFKDTMMVKGVVENNKGKWVELCPNKNRELGLNNRLYSCSHCDFKYRFGIYQYSFCPNCGADMR